MSDQPEDIAAVPALRLAVDNSEVSSNHDLPMSLRILFDQKLFNNVNELSKIMAGDSVITPVHLRGKPHACHTVIVMALEWRLQPPFVARCTYMTPGGQIGFEGKLVQSILEKSNRFIGAPDFVYCGDWNKVTGKFVKATSQKGNEYTKPSWTAADAEGCGITMYWKVRGEEKPRVWPGEDMPFYLTQCYPLNSPLWGTDPRSQIRYLVIRRFADQAAPGILGGMPFDANDFIEASERATDITPATAPPRPTRESVAQEMVTEVEPEPENPPYAVTGYTADTEYFADPKAACENWFLALDWADKNHGTKGIEAVWESNDELYAALDANLFTDLTSIIRDVYTKRHEAAVAREKLSAATGGPGTSPAAEVAPETTQATVAPPLVTAGAPPADDGEIPFDDDPPAQTAPAAPAQADLPEATPTAPAGVGGLGLGVPARDPIWDSGDLAFDPVSLRNKPDWVGYTNRLCRVIGDAQSRAELEAMMTAHSKNLIFLSTSNPRGYQQIADLTAGKQREFEIDADATC